MVFFYQCIKLTDTFCCIDFFRWQPRPSFSPLAWKQSYDDRLTMFYFRISEICVIQLSP